MADVNVNTGEQDYSETVDKLVEIRSRPLKKLEDQKEEGKTKIAALSQMIADLTNLQIAADKVYGIDSGFRRRKAESSDESVLSAEAIDGAENGSYQVKVKQLATSQRLAGAEIEMPSSLPSGDFRFKVADKEYGYRFGGGSISSLAQMMASSDSPVRLSPIKIDAKKTMAVLSSEQKGKDSNIELLKDDAGIFTTVLKIFNPSEDQTVILIDGADRRSKGEEPAKVEGRTIVLPVKGDEIFSKEVLGLTKGSYLSFQLKWDNALPTEEKRYQDLSEEQKKQIGLGQTKGGPDDTTKLYSIPYKPDVSDNSLTFIAHYTVDGNEEVKNYKVDMSDFFDANEKEARFDLGSFFTEGGSPNLSVKSLEIKSNKLFGAVSIENPIVFIKADENKKFKAIRELDKPKDTLLEYQGIEVARDGLEVKDLIPRLTLKIKRASENPVNIVVSSNEKAAKQRITDFLGQFNYVVRRLNIFVGRSENPPEMDEREQRLYGLFKSEMNVVSFRLNLIGLNGNFYPTSDSRTISSLSQIGISPVHPGFNVNDMTSLDFGLLDFNESEFDQKTAENPDLVREVFGYDPNKTGIISSGFAYQVSSLVRTQVGPSRMFSILRDGIASSGKFLDEKIEREKKAIDAFRIKQQGEFGRLRAAQEQMKKMQQMLRAYSQ